MSFEPYIFEEEPNKDKDKNTHIPRRPLQPFEPSPKKNYLNLIQNITQIIVNVLFILFLITSLMLGSSFFKNVSKQESNMNWFKDKKVDFTKKLPNVKDDFHGNQIVKKEIIKLIEDIKKPKTTYDTKDDNEKIPSGILLCGPPGTGKTYLAKCLAGSVKDKASFFVFNGSDFVELYVGRGAARVRDAFKYAKRETLADGNKYCFIFIDEIESIGRKRSDHVESSHLEQESTLNALLTEIDGFISSSKKGSNPHVILIGATNRDDLLDPALTREGRLGKKIEIQLPNQQDIKELLVYFSKTEDLKGASIFSLFQKLKLKYPDLSKDLSKDPELLKQLTSSLSKDPELLKYPDLSEDPELLKKLTSSYDNLMLVLQSYQITPSEVISLIQNIKNKIKESKSNIVINPDNVMDFIWDSFDTLKIGAISEEEETKTPSKRIIAHELGHALVAKSLGLNISRVNVQTRNHIGGYTIVYRQNGEDDLQTRNDFIKKIVWSLGGRAGEEIFLNPKADDKNDFDFSTGSENDLLQVKLIVEQMVKKLGMSWPTINPNESIIKNKIVTEPNKMDEEINTIINNAYLISKSILSQLKDNYDKYINDDPKYNLLFTSQSKTMNELQFNQMYKDKFQNSTAIIDYKNLSVKVERSSLDTQTQ